MRSSSALEGCVGGADGAPDAAPQRHGVRCKVLVLDLGRRRDHPGGRGGADAQRRLLSGARGRRRQPRRGRRVRLPGLQGSDGFADAHDEHQDIAQRSRAAGAPGQLGQHPQSLSHRGRRRGPSAHLGAARRRLPLRLQEPALSAHAPGPPEGPEGVQVRVRAASRPGPVANGVGSVPLLGVALCVGRERKRLHVHDSEPHAVRR
mmetsp:Transcript_2226/g.5321  ORF Transcript_2226/g.5321 Transcript_2226/m.5321 type:complete len:205 (+) Transcript_2226:866-1480(+)